MVYDRFMNQLLMKIQVALILMAIFAYQNCNVFPVRCASGTEVLMPGSIVREGNNTTLVRIIHRDGSFLCLRCKRASLTIPGQV